jgi:glycerol-3-phosphate dehydrogenase
MSVYDLVIVGGGIHGAGVAQAAAAAGHTVLVLEQSAIAAGTSGRSSKLIHGGLRYLESGQLRLVRESLYERATLLRLAPDLVHLRRFHIPIYRATRRRPWQLRVGLSAYSVLAGLDGAARFGTVPRDRWHDLDGLETRDLRKVFWYYDAQTDDQALTRAVMRSAAALGAHVTVPARFVRATLGAREVQVLHSGPAGDAECHARVLVNAAGPWAAAVARRIAPAVPVPEIDLVQGTHISCAGRLERGMYYVESPRDGRAVFVMPWREQVLIGTTEVRFRGDPAAVHPTEPEVNYLLGVVRHYFPRYRDLDASRLTGSFAGLRVLPAGPGHAFHRSRETLLVTDRPNHPRLLSIYGGKLTTYRAVAERIMTRIAGSLANGRPIARTDRLPLTAD